MKLILTVSCMFIKCIHIALGALWLNLCAFVPQLFVREPEERLGTKGNIRHHSFFSSTDWNALEQRQVPAPFTPTIVSTTGNHLLNISTNFLS